MIDVDFIKSGRWALSRPVFDGSGWTTYAEQQRLAPTVENYFPPIRNGAPIIDSVLVRLIGDAAVGDANTQFFPRALLGTQDITLSELTSVQRTALRNFASAWMPGYSFRDYDGAQRDISAFSERANGYSGITSLKEVARDMFLHLGHSRRRPRLGEAEVHNTEYLDDFSTDPFSAPRWTNDRGTHVWDSGNSEMDCSLALSPFALRYTANTSGSNQHESQCTFIVFSAGGFASGGCSVRADSGGCYFMTYDPDADQIRLRRSNTSFSENVTLATYSSVTMAANDFITQRNAASGADGENVVLDVWYNNHGSSKPADPGWFGVDGSPTQTYTDTDAARRDDAGHSYCGIAGGGTGGDTDTRHCHWKQRAIADRSAGGPVIPVVLADEM